MCRSAEAFESKDKTLSSLARFQQVLCCSFFLLSSITNSLPSIYVVLHREEDKLSALSRGRQTSWARRGPR